MYTTLLFDADETLFDFRRSEREAFFATLPTATEADYAFYSEENDKLWHRLNAGELTKDFLTLERWRIFADYAGLNLDPAATNEAYKTALAACSFLLEGAEALCKSLKSAGCSLYIIPNGVAKVQQSRIAASPIAPLLDGVFISEEIGAVKPNPAYFTAVAKAIPHFDRAKTLIIGDSPDSDIKGGNLSDIDTLWYNPQNNPIPSDITPTHIAHSYSDILRLLL